jgi:hypothetical protein
MRPVVQEGKPDKAISSFMGDNARAPAVGPAAKRRVAREGTIFAGLRKPLDLVVIVATRLAYGCPIQAEVYAYGLDERMVESPAGSRRQAL